jgi:hypothetical protein
MSQAEERSYIGWVSSYIHLYLSTDILYYRQRFFHCPDLEGYLALLETVVHLVCGLSSSPTLRHHNSKQQFKFKGTFSARNVCPLIDLAPGGSGSGSPTLLFKNKGGSLRVGHLNGKKFRKLN